MDWQYVTGSDHCNSWCKDKKRGAFDETLTTGTDMCCGYNEWLNDAGEVEIKECYLGVAADLTAQVEPAEEATLRAEIFQFTELDAYDEEHEWETHFEDDMWEDEMGEDDWDYFCDMYDECEDPYEQTWEEGCDMEAELDAICALRIFDMFFLCSFDEETWEEENSDWYNPDAEEYEYDEYDEGEDDTMWW